ncbi:hypothetical protein SGLAM104S_10161 [Streptomyces glaucescens]
MGVLSSMEGPPQARAGRIRCGVSGVRPLGVRRLYRELVPVPEPERRSSFERTGGGSPRGRFLRRGPMNWQVNSVSQVGSTPAGGSLPSTPPVRCVSACGPRDTGIRSLSAAWPGPFPKGRQDARIRRAGIPLPAGEHGGPAPPDRGVGRPPHGRRLRQPLPRRRGRHLRPRGCTSNSPAAPRCCPSTPSSRRSWYDGRGDARRALGRRLHLGVGHHRGQPPGHRVLQGQGRSHHRVHGLRRVPRRPERGRGPRLRAEGLALRPADAAAHGTAARTQGRVRGVREARRRTRRGLPGILLDVARQAEPTAAAFAEAHKDTDYHFLVGGGNLWGFTYLYSMCILEEMQWLRTTRVHSAEFFHGSLELLEEDTSVLVFQGEDEDPHPLHRPGRGLRQAHLPRRDRLRHPRLSAARHQPGVPRPARTAGARHRHGPGASTWSGCADTGWTCAATTASWTTETRGRPLPHRTRLRRQRGAGPAPSSRPRTAARGRRPRRRLTYARSAVRSPQSAPVAPVQSPVPGARPCPRPWRAGPAHRRTHESPRLRRQHRRPVRRPRHRLPGWQQRERGRLRQTPRPGGGVPRSVRRRRPRPLPARGHRGHRGGRRPLRRARRRERRVHPPGRLRRPCLPRLERRRRHRA